MTLSLGFWICKHFSSVKIFSCYFKMENSNISNVTTRMKYLYQSSQWYDLEFHVKDDSTGKLVVLRAHRLILAPTSDVFEALCFGPLAEKVPVLVTDIEAEAFDVMLQFLYTDFIHLQSVEMALNLLYAAKKYLVTSLSALTGKYLSENIRDGNCIDIFNLATMVDKNDLAQLAYEHIRRRLNHVQKYFHSDNIRPELVLKLVTSKNLNCSEVTLVSLSQTWAKHACALMGLEETSANMRNLLLQYDIFQNIRWHILSDDELPIVIPGILSEEEISSRTSCSKSEFRRDECPLKEAYVHRYTVDAVRTHHITAIRDGITIVTQLTVNRSVSLGAIIINAKSTPVLLQRKLPLQSYRERMELTIKHNEEVVFEQHINQDVFFGNRFIVHLDRGFPLVENSTYDICIQVLNSVRDYPFEVLSTVTKIPSGLSVTCVETADLTVAGVFENALDLSLITGFVFLC